MSSTTSSSNAFLCPACGARFAWKPDLAGRKVRCKCGTDFAVPFAPGEAGTAAINLAPAGPAAAAPARPAAAVGVPSQYAHNAGLMPKQYTAEPEDPSATPSALKDLYVPPVLIVVGAVLRLVQLMFLSETGGNQWGGAAEAPRGFAVAVGLILCETVVTVAVMLGGALLSFRIMDVELGSLGRAAFKLLALAVFAAGTASLTAVIDRDRYSVAGLVLAWHVMIVLYWIGFAFFFSLGLQETVLTVAIVGVLQALVFLGMWGSGF